jgi:hypothetical protein
MTINLPKRVAENIDQFTGRSWLLPCILEWWNQRSERFFFLTAGPGTGKSMILAWLAGFGPAPHDLIAQAQLKHVRSLVKATHFCRADNRSNSPQAFAESIANQLIGSVKGFAEALASTLDGVQITALQTIGAVATGGAAINLSVDMGALGDEPSFDRAFTKPLKKLYESGYAEPMLLLVDAFDEAQTYSGQVTGCLAPIPVITLASKQISCLTIEELDALVDGHGAHANQRY